jgi:succinyl-CoA synthetase beta subunit
MNIHEYQAKELLKKYGVAVPEGKVASTKQEAVQAAKELGGDIWVVKAQVYAGGRGKAGGVKLCKTLDEVEKAADDIIGMTLVTHQTGPEGKPVDMVYVEKGSNIKQELYLAITLDRATSRLTFMASTEGGMDIEKVAEETPEKIFHTSVNPVTGFMPYQGREVAFKMGLTDPTQVRKYQQFMSALYNCFMDLDGSIVEINPLVITEEGDVLALDAKMNFDDNALFRHADIEAMWDEKQEDAKEVEAAKHELNYISLDGEIGCMVNGAGLAMSTMDIIQHFGGSPANFLDVGGSATEERVKKAFEIILSDANVKGILVNIFGGIMKCDVIAKGVVAAAKGINLSVPLVVRLEGTNVEEGKKILAESGLKITSANDLGDAAEKIVNEVKSARAA